jgi:hypothetical protein
MVGLEEDEINHNEINATTLYRRMTSFLAVKLSCGHIATTVVRAGVHQSLIAFLLGNFQSVTCT